MKDAPFFPANEQPAIKLSIAIAGAQALPSAFVVFRGFAESMQKAAALGFEGVELAMKNAYEIQPSRLRQLLTENRLEVSCISTGQIYAEKGLTLTHENPVIRKRAMSVFKELTDFASEFGKLVNIGRVRGSAGNRPPREVKAVFVDVARELAGYALSKGVTLVLEPVNRYESDFINTISEGVALVKEIDRENFMLMPDLFHMNIEDVDMAGQLTDNLPHIKYIHLADSNRKAPGYGHTDFDNVFGRLIESGYKGWAAVEILPLPSPDAAARQAAGFLQSLLMKHSIIASNHYYETIQDGKRQSAGS